MTVDRDMVLVAEGRDGDVDRRNRSVRPCLGLAELDRPARVAVLVPELGGLGLPGLGNASVLDGLLLLLGIALLGRGDQRSVDDLAAHGDVTGLAQRRVEPVEQRLDRLGPGQLLAEQPDRAGVGNPVGQAQPEKPHERQAVVDQKLGTLVGEGVRRLNHQDLEHHHGVERRPAAL